MRLSSDHNPNRHGPCQVCGTHTYHGIIAVNGRLVCDPCWAAIERRPGRVVGREIADGLRMMAQRKP